VNLSAVSVNRKSVSPLVWVGVASAGGPGAYVKVTVPDDVDVVFFVELSSIFRLKEYCTMTVADAVAKCHLWHGQKYPLTVVSWMF